MDAFTAAAQEVRLEQFDRFENLIEMLGEKGVLAEILWGMSNDQLIEIADHLETINDIHNC